MAQLSQGPVGGSAGRAPERASFLDRSAADRDLEDLIHSWERLEDPALRRLAVRLIRTLGEGRRG